MIYMKPLYPSPSYCTYHCRYLLVPSVESPYVFSEYEGTLAIVCQIFPRSAVKNVTYFSPTSVKVSLALIFVFDSSPSHSRMLRANVIHCLLEHHHWAGDSSVLPRDLEAGCRILNPVDNVLAIVLLVWATQTLFFSSSRKQLSLLLNKKMA